MPDFLEPHVAVKQHIRYFLHHLNILPARAASQDSIRMTIAFFAISGLDILNGLDKITRERKIEMIDWIYSLQVVPHANDSVESWKRCGFQGSSTLNFSTEKSDDLPAYKCGHIAMTYVALASLLILGDDLARVNKTAILAGIKSLQQPDGSFQATLAGSENDMRFVYCAACICFILNDWSSIDRPRTVEFIITSISYDHGIAQGPELESHGGTTFCAVAALSLMGQIDASLTPRQLAGLKKWTIMRQITGFQGRPNKPADTCYSFWVGSTLKLLGTLDQVDFNKNKDYVLSTQDPLCGGFSKWVDSSPDPLHTYLGLCGLSLMNDPSVSPISPSLNISQRAFTFLQRLHHTWEKQ